MQAPEKQRAAERKATVEQPEPKSIGELLSGREPRLDVIQFSAPWRLFPRIFGAETR